MFNLDVLIGLRVSWSDYEPSFIASNKFSFPHYSGVIISVHGGYAVIQVEGEVRLQEFSFFSLAGLIKDESIKQSLYKHMAALRRQEKWNDPTPHAIYALVDPRDNTIRYIGMTRYPELRYRHHIHCGGDNPHKNAWIRELQSQSLQPQLAILEETTGKQRTLQREQYWIQFYLRRGAPLTNLDASWLRDWLQHEVEDEI